MAKQNILDTGNTIALQYPDTRVNYNTFDLSHPHKLSGNFGNLYPVLMEECLPGDRFSAMAEVMARLQPMLAPTYQKLKMRIDFFNVDNILLWPNFYKFISPLQAGDIPPAAPTFNALNFPAKSLGDYLGLPAKNVNGVDATLTVSALPFAAYQKVCLDWYFDTDLESGGKDSAFQLPLADGSNNASFTALNALRQRNMDRGYFTSAKPFAQKGNPVVIPITGTSIPVTVIDPTKQAFAKTTPSGGTPASGNLTVAVGGGVQAGTTNLASYIDPNGSLGISAASALSFASTINDLRAAEAMQAFLEAELFGGNRYQEYVETMFHEKTDDRRMFRATYLDSFSQDISISEVLNTTGTATAPQGTIAGHGFAMVKHPDGVHFTAKEHGWFVGILSVIPVQPSFYQGIRREFMRSDRFSYATPMLAELGAQSILNSEIMISNASGDSLPFGYVPRYTEYRMGRGKVTGDFKTSLDFWQLDFKTASLPALGAPFLQSISDYSYIYRNFAVTDPTVDHLLFYCYFRLKVNRALPRIVRPQ